VVEETDVVACGVAQTDVPAFVRTSAVNRDGMELVDFQTEFLQYFQGIIGGTIVDDNQLQGKCFSKAFLPQHRI
jgi:hypothetical protein